MREELLGYVLGALEPEEEHELEARLETDADLRRELQELRRLLHEGPEEVWDARETAELEPPPQLAKRTITSVDAVRRVPPPLVPVLESGASGSGWRRSDAIAMIGIATAALILVMPMLALSRQRAQVAACRDRMREVGRALIEYSRDHGGNFPEMTTEGPLAHAGVYAVRLREAGYLPDTNIAFCPAMHQDENDERLPTWLELAAARDEEVEVRFASMTGLYGYTLGYVEEGRYHSPRNHDRTRVAVLGDAPTDDGRRASGHGCGRNVWFEDGHAEFLNTCRLHVGEDALYENRHGLVGAGIGKDDVVIGSAAAKPRITQLKLER